MKPALFRLRLFSVKEVDEQDLLATRPVFHRGKKRQGFLLIHGLTGSPAGFYDYGRELTNRGYTVSIPLLPGHGTTPQDLKEVKWSEWVECALQSYDAIREICDQVFVIGISMGALIALELAARRKDIAKLFLLSPALKMSLWGALMGGFIVRLYPILAFFGLENGFHIGGDIKDPSRYEIGYRKTPLRTIVELDQLLKDTLERLPSIHTDAMIFISRGDHLVHQEVPEIVRKDLGSKNKEIIFVDNSYHLISVDYDRSYILDRILKSINSKDS